jgi:hypothetical protein
LTKKKSNFVFHLTISKSGEWVSFHRKKKNTNGKIRVVRGTKIKGRLNLLKVREKSLFLKLN